MRHYWLTSDAPDLPVSAFRRALGKNRPVTLEGGKGSSAPSAPDPWTTAAATTSTNENTAAYNKALNLNNYTNPFGSQSTVQTGTDPNSGAPIYGTTTSISSPLQYALNNQLGMAGQAAGLQQYGINGLEGLQSQYSGLNSGLSGLQGQVSALGSTLSPQAAQQAQQQGMSAAYNSSMGYLNPQFQQQQESTNAQLANQGLGVGSEAWNNAQGNLSRNQTFQQQQALNNAELTGSQMGTQNWNNQLAGLSAQSGLLNQQAGLYGQMGSNLGAQGGLYGNIGNMGNSIISGVGSLASLIPGYSGTGQSAAAPADIASYMNNQYQSQLAGYNANNASTNSTIGTLGTLGGAAMIAMGF